jgi:hypothetical protein
MTNYPTSLDSLTDPVAGQPLNNPSMAGIATNANDAIVALETKVGVDSSAVTTTIDYKLKNSASIDPGHHHTNSTLDSIASSKVSGATFPSSGLLVGTTDTQTLTNKTIAGGSNTISGITEAMQSTSDVTTLNVSTSKHGYAPKSPNDATQYLDGTGNYSKPSTFIFKNGVTTYDVSTASGTQTIAHGLGKTPSLVKITAMMNSSLSGNYAPTASWGVYNGTTNSCVFMALVSSTSITGGGEANQIIALWTDTSLGKGQTALATFDATNITLTWTKTSTPSGTAELLWEAIG